MQRLELAIDRGAEVNCARNRPPRVVAFLSFGAGGHPGVRELVNRYQQGRFNACRFRKLDSSIAMV
jgi:hypothetical protein